MKQDIMIALVLSPFIAYCAYRAIKSALEPPVVTKRRISCGEDENGTPIYDDDCDVEATLELWKEQSRLIRQSCS